MNYDISAGIIKDIVLANTKPYKSFNIFFTQDEDDPGQMSWLMLVSFRNLAQHSPRQQELIAEWINVVLAKINAAGVPCGLARVE